MNRFCIALFGQIAMFTGATGAMAAYTYTTLDVPGASNTYARAISGNTIAGSYSVSGVSHGFTKTGNAYTTVDYPTAASTWVFGISGDTIVGIYYKDGGHHGFIRSGGVYSTLESPMASVVEPSGISGSTIAGFYKHPSGIAYSGFTLTGGTYTSLDAPGTTDRTFVYGISGNTLVGTYYTAATGDRGFTWTGSVFTPVEIGLWGTRAYGIDGSRIVGEFTDYTGTHGFLQSGKSYTTLDFPAEVQGTYAWGVAGDTVVGYYLDAANVAHGFVVTVPEPAAIGLLGAGTLGLIRRRRARPAV